MPNPALIDSATPDGPAFIVSDQHGQLGLDRYATGQSSVPNRRNRDCIDHMGADCACDD
jgi:hypothetical protein